MHDFALGADIKHICALALIKVNHFWLVSIYISLWRFLCWLPLGLETRKHGRILGPTFQHVKISIDLVENDRERTVRMLVCA